MITLLCEQCGQPYQAKPYMAKISERHFCGFACYGEWQKTYRKGVGAKSVIVTCDTCGKQFERVPSNVKERNFCDQKCASIRKSQNMTGDRNPTWQGGHMSYRGENWNRQRQAARQRDGDTCQTCGTKKNCLPVHHKIPFHLFQDYREANGLDNLVTLCPKCHGKAEIAYLRNNPNTAGLRQFPFVVPVRPCEQCSVDFSPRSGATKFCDNCCTASCVNCKKTFFSRKATFRTLKYCSVDCRAAHIKRPFQICKACGKKFFPGRTGLLYCSKDCHMTKANPRRQFCAKRKLSAQE